MRDFALETYMSRWEFVAKYNMTASDAESMRLPELLAMASDEDRADFENLSLGYTETFGAPALRQQIAVTYDTVGPENLICFAGAEEGIYVAMKVLLTADDHAIVITPNYQAAETIPLSICAVTGVALDISNDWELDVGLVERALRPNTKLISINFPNNPTGKILPRATFDALIGLCRKHGIWLFSDEVYRLIEKDETLRLPQAVDVYERGISLNVMSKAYGLPGLRIGWLASRDRDFLVRCERYKHFLSICNSAPSEILARIALKSRDRILARTRAIVRNNLGVLNDFFAEFPHLFDWREPDGGCVAFIRYRGADGVEEFTRRVVEEAGVFFLPSSVYRSDLTPVPENCLRIGFGRQHVPEGLTALRNWLRRTNV
ncbi:aminotransferase class I/II-fold pyridoxal phosphate-dependent enzyme [Rhizobium herbae]|uniref:Aminotransferase class I/II-fold pyridoxal phosphate-dependent enzyme n=2 Tax=Rhizobium herbae TaxID=508661 RepID=A0ABS7H9I7_9HYPH|nr:aminotransferase class I/II-fold pyridoxal phosphate-dependent enzyme [Rhizobium herbae]MBW9063119.1 aminotransferase class I/II-fold pyridoxal phosphate-dependent enzyme [Rhizobium herbae]